MEETYELESTEKGKVGRTHLRPFYDETTPTAGSLGEKRERKKRQNAPPRTIRRNRKERVEPGKVAQEQN